MALVQPRPCLVVSDLDDTMVGDDAASSAFRRWWEAEGVVAGGRLAYNTGRALVSLSGPCGWEWSSAPWAVLGRGQGRAVQACCKCCWEVTRSGPEPLADGSIAGMSKGAPGRLCMARCGGPMHYVRMRAANRHNSQRPPCEEVQPLQLC